MFPAWGCLSPPVLLNFLLSRSLLLCVEYSFLGPGMERKRHVDSVRVQQCSLVVVGVFGNRDNDKAAAQAGNAPEWCGVQFGCIAIAFGDSICPRLRSSSGRSPVRVGFALLFGLPWGRSEQVFGVSAFICAATRVSRN